MANTATKLAIRWLGPATLRQWVEWAGLAGVACAATVLVWFRDEFSNAQLVVAWVSLGAGLLFLLRAGWVRLFGPVLVYDLVRNARRARTYLTRCGYLLLLLFFLVTIVPRPPSHRSLSAQRPGDSAREMAAVAESFFATFMGVQFGLVVFLTPAYVAGAIAEEKERKTLEYLLASDLDSREIVLGKLAARLGYLTLLLLTGLPVLSALQLLGGVSPMLVFAGFAATALTAASLSGIGILASVYARTSRQAIFRTYLTIILYCGLCVALSEAARAHMFASYGRLIGGGPTFNEFVRPVLDGNPVFALLHVFDWSRGLPQEMPEVLMHYAIFHGAVALLTIAVAVLRLRSVALGDVAASRARVSERAGSRTVSDSPMIWKETHFGGSRLRLWSTTLLVMGVMLSFSPVPFYLEAYSRHPREFYADDALAREFNAYVRVVGTIVASLALLGVAVRASVTIRTERDKNTLDALLASPLTTREILVGKWIGCLRGMRWPALWLGSIYFIGVLTGGLSLLAVPLLAAVIAVYAGTLAVVGLWFSVVCKTTVRATVATVAAVLGLSVGHWLLWLCCLSLPDGHGSGRNSQDIVKLQAGITPPIVLGVVLPFSASRLDEIDRRNATKEMAGFTIFGTIAWIVLGGVWWALLNDRFQIDVNRSDFDPEKRVPKPGVGLVQ